MEIDRKKSREKWLSVLIVSATILALVVIILPVFQKAREKATISTRQSFDEKALDVVPGSAPSVSWDTVYAASQSRLIIKTASVDLEVADVDASGRKITGMADRAGGFVTSSTSNNYGTESASIVLRVPAKHYKSVLDQIRKLGKVTSIEEQGQDITEEYIDLQSRLRNLQREEDAFLKILGTARRVPDVLAVERELSRVRGEIEQSTGRIKYLQNQVALSTITVNLSEPTPVVSHIVNWDIGQTVKGASNALLVVLRTIISLVIWLVIFVPVWIILGAVVYGFRRRMARRRA